MGLLLSYDSFYQTFGPMGLNNTTNNEKHLMKYSFANYKYINKISLQSQRHLITEPQRGDSLVTKSILHNQAP